ncbi:HERV-H LTR-associating protein 2 isoform X2 [Rhinatrema bivittatum]|uniref:HERV-H LTR-associating protein 2 isoform X2 n=1 Tax=Rhinatrema bivittatum TaxID=194408 RepID=UPI001129DF12|nr:HERV-H LTR-associating protein 2 isoform X2 [Rhinatrema bivittatum]
MKDLAILSLLFFLLSSQFSAISGFHEIFGQYAREVVLPCSFNPHTNKIIHWQRPAEEQDIVVHSHYYGKDQLTKQAAEYLNRTALFYDEIENGNASLILKQLHLQDEGLYKCYVTTIQEAFLKVTAFGSSSLSYATQNNEVVLQCSAEGVHPLPTITWSSARGSVDETRRTEGTIGGLMTVTSELNIANSSEAFKCLIQSPVLNLNWTGVWEKPEHLFIDEYDEALLPCYFPSSLNLTDVMVSWSLTGNRNLASFNNSMAVVEDPRVKWVQVNKQSNFSIVLKDLTISDNGNYLCSISSPDYMQLAMTSLSVGKKTITDRRVTVMFVVLFCVLLAAATWNTPP